MLRDFAAAFDKARDEKVACAGIPQNDAWPRRGWNDVDAVPQLLIRDRRRLPRFDPRLGGNFHTGTALRHIGVVCRPTAGRPVASIVGPEASGAAADCAVADVENRSIEAPERKIVGVAVRDRARRVDHFRSDDAADDTEALALGD